MLSFDEFKDLVTDIVSTQQKQNIYIELIPADLTAAITENFYVHELNMLHERFISVLFKDLAEDVFWLLYEQLPAQKPIVSNTRCYSINTLEDFFLYIQEEYYS